MSSTEIVNSCSTWKSYSAGHGLLITGTGSWAVGWSGRLPAAASHLPAIKHWKPREALLPPAASVGLIQPTVVLLRRVTTTTRTLESSVPA